jgi:hypothetical protein
MLEAATYIMDRISNSQNQADQAAISRAAMLRALDFLKNPVTQLCTLGPPCDQTSILPLPSIGQVATAVYNQSPTLQLANFVISTTDPVCAVEHATDKDELIAAVIVWAGTGFEPWGAALGYGAGLYAHCSTLWSHKFP